jgi:predicted lipid-binding transport protein (Tim44 family)
MKDERKLSTSDIATAAPAQGPAHTADDLAPAAAPRATAEAPAPLFANEDAAGYRTRWSAIQTGFVDEPRKAVEEADALVAGVMKRLAEVFADERRQLESQWERADQVSTEDLRLAMRRYRSFFERLLSI